MGEIRSRPPWLARNWAADAGEGSIHDDATAEKLGFRGGTVPGDVHMNQFPALLVETLGEAWFERGNLSLYFRNATVDLEPVQAFIEMPDEGSVARVWMERDDGLLVCEGTASIGEHEDTAIRRRDLRPCDPAELKILHRLSPGLSLGHYDVFAAPERQLGHLEVDEISDPLAWYRDSSPWGGPVAAPSTALQSLWAPVMAGLMPLVDDSVGLFGAIEIGFHQPMLLSQHYHIESEVVCVGQSPQTEYVWYDSTATNEAGEPVAFMRMQSRSMKASSPAYANN